jgi:hypothetical protein
VIRAKIYPDVDRRVHLGSGSKQRHVFGRAERRSCKRPEPVDLNANCEDLDPQRTSADSAGMVVSALE